MRRSTKAEILVKEENKIRLQARRWKTVDPTKRRQISFHLSKIHPATQQYLQAAFSKRSSAPKLYKNLSSPCLCHTCPTKIILEHFNILQNTVCRKILSSSLQVWRTVSPSGFVLHRSEYVLITS